MKYDHIDIQKNKCSDRIQERMRNKGKTFYNEEVKTIRNMRANKHYKQCHMRNRHKGKKTVKPRRNQR